MGVAPIPSGVHRLGTEWVNWYLVESDSQVTVVDTAMPGYYPQLEPALRSIGREIHDIRAIVLTHEHGVLFTGDAMASVSWISGSTDPQLHPFGEDRARMPAALDALEPLEADLVAFGHGEPFRGSPAAAVASAREQMAVG